jgi:hypothetical protein
MKEGKKKATGRHHTHNRNELPHMTDATLKTRLASLRVAAAKLPQARVQFDLLVEAISDDIQAVADRVERLELHAARGWK